MTGHTIDLCTVSKHWGETQSLREVDLSLEAGKFTAILGPSGCGKSTMLRIIAGLESVSTGAVRINGRDVTQQPPAKRGLSMVFQSYALFPHLNVAENILFGLKVARVGRSDRMRRLTEVADLLELTPYLDRKPAALSGGQQQRVALGRAVISQRPICLMDEPLSNLDARLRDEMRREIRRLQRALGFTMVYVTHDQTEAITMADTVVLMNKGRVEQVATPQMLYQAPATPFAARFIGTPPMNLLSPAAFGPGFADLASDLRIGLRPETLELQTNGPLKAEVVSAEYLGADTLVECHTQGMPFLAKLKGNHVFALGQPIALGFDGSASHLFDLTQNRRLEDPLLAARLADFAGPKR